LGEVTQNLRDGDVGSAMLNTALAVTPMLAGWMDDVLRNTDNVPTYLTVPTSNSSQYWGARGQYSGREFDPDWAGGPIRELSMENVKITQSGIDVVEQHITRFDGGGEYEMAMLDRLRRIVLGEIPATQYDINFYTHELREFVRYRRLGYETGLPPDAETQGILWENTHAATLEDYQLHEISRDEFGNKTRSLFHPEVWDGR
jgi:hypothetical protein